MCARENWCETHRKGKRHRDSTWEGHWMPLSPGVEFHDAEPTDVSKRQGCFYLVAEFGSVFLYGPVFLEGEARREKILDEDN